MMVNRNVIDGYKTVWGYIGVLTMITGVILLTPLLVLVFYPSETRYAADFLIPAFTALLVGGLLSLLIRGRRDVKLSLRQDTIVIVLAWMVAAFFSGLPFLLSGQLNFTQAMFEAVSGWTTTGLSVVNVTVTPKIFLMHRSIMQFFGGIGIVLVMVSALSSTYGMQLYSAEGHSDKLLPNLAKSARIVISIYSGYIVAGSILYVVFGMSWFDAINHSIAALSTGGFSTRADSIGAYKSTPIDIVTIVLMLLGTTNFAAHLLLIRGKFKAFFRIGEIRFMFLVLAIATPVLAFFSLAKVYRSIPQALQAAGFNAVSALSTTGFSTVSYNNWGPLAILIMVVLMLIGGGIGSTAGAIKLYRVHVLFKALIWNIKKNFLPENTVNETYVCRPEGKVYIDAKRISEVSMYAFIYLVLFFIGTAVMTAYGYSLEDSLFEFASTIGTVGLSIGVTSPHSPAVVLWTQIAGMLFGRLEIYVIFVAVIKASKDLRASVKSKVK
ncbi:TrkH family potassium uptake protein [Alicyclobacillus sp. SO9]|uniref:TrkH family potassium uptake protein n=1 Tax=Alicyclobacillus sp. SO9 TaxID=2665646 RepID=UPI001E51E46D|nr:TrkH family potassium uptake protein [Alicyclobacillus sp. SO9]